VDIFTSDQQVIILDAGTGIRRLGLRLMEEYPHRAVGTILVSHTHWDHIQGFPFFTPAFVRQNRFVLVGQKRVGQTLENVIRGQVVEPYLPFGYKELEADLMIKEISDGEYMVIGNETLVQARELTHPGGCLGYRIENAGTVLAYCTDTGHGEEALDPNVLRLAEGADLLIHDSQFSLEQRERFPAWGHSSWLEACRVAQEAGARNLALFHYDPAAGDAELETMLSRAREIFPRTFLAQEGLAVHLPLAATDVPAQV
jgi:phosphoribosyl 1,2-cyclic phosphodiesterase